MANDRTVTGNEAQFNEKVIFLRDIEVAGKITGEFTQDIDTDLLSANNLNISGSSYLNNLEVSGLGTFTKRLDVGIGGTLFTAINSGDGVPNHQGRVGIGTTQPDGLFQVGNKCLTIVVDPCRVGIGTTQPDARLQVGAGFTSFNVTSDGNVGLGTTQPSAQFQLGLGNTSLSITGFGSVGLGITDPLSTFHLNGNNSDVSIISGLGTNTLRVGIGTTMPWTTPYGSSQREGAVNLIDDSANGPLRLSVEGSIAITRNIYDSAGSPGGNNWWMRRDETGIRWVAVEPERSDGIFIQDEGSYIPTVGAAQSFSTLNFVQVNSLGIGTDTLVPTVGSTDDTEGSAGLSTIFTNDLWGFTGSGNNASIYRMTKVGVKNNAPDRDLDVTGTLRATLAVDFDSTLDVDGKTTFNDATDSSGSTSSSSVQIDGGVGIVKKLYVGGDTKVESNNDASASNAAASLQVVGGVAIGKKLYVGDDTKVEKNTTSTSPESGALQVVGGVGVQENLYVKELVRFQKNQTSTNSSSGTLVVTGGVGIGENLNIADITRIETSQQSTSTASGALQVEGGAGIKGNVYVGDNVDIGNDLNVTRFSTFGNDVTFTGSSYDLFWDKDQNSLEFKDETKATFGNGRDLQISHTNSLAGQNDSEGNSIVDGWTSYIEETGAGSLVFKTNGGPGDGAYQFFDKNWKAILKLYSGDSARAALYWGGTERLVTTEDGIDVTGHTETDTFRVSGVSTHVGISTFENAVGIGSTLSLWSNIKDVNDNIGVGAAQTDWRLASVGAGVSWRPSGVQTKRTIWVTKSGNDSNSGLLEGDAKATIGAAAAIAEETDTIKVRPGVYYENNPIGLRTDVSITGEDLRLVTVIPLNEDQSGNESIKDVFHVRNGCLIENLNFAGKTHTTSHLGAGAVAFPPDTEDDKARSGYISLGPFKVPGSKRYKSPYVRNCTNFMTESIGMKIDGNHATAATFGQDLKSMVCDSFTQYNEAGIGVSLTNDAYAQLVSIFTINSDIAIYADTGGQCDLTNSNSSFGNFGLVAVGLGSTQFTGIVSNTNPAGDIIGSTNAGEQDTVVCADVLDELNNPRRPFDGQALFFKINLDNYPDVQGNGILEEPLTQLESIKLNDGVDLSGFSAIDPPSVIIRDADGIQEPKGPQGIIAEATATVDAQGNLTEIDVIAQGRNYLPTQNIEVSIEGDTSLATAVMNPIYYTVDAATNVVESGNKTGLTTITFNEFIPYELFPGDEFSLKRISRILTSSHSFEYVGTGTDINRSTPLQGAIPIKANEIVATDGAQIPFTSTDQKGNFDIGEGIQIDQTTSTIRGRDFSRAIQAEVTPLILALR